MKRVETEERNRQIGQECSLYPAYRDYMHDGYGPGPWRPREVEPGCRWREWVKRQTQEAA